MVPIGSIFLTIVLPAIVIYRNDRNRPVRRPYLFSVGSFLFCCIAMIQEILTIKRRLLAGDIGGIEDTIGAVLIICIGTLVAAVVLNVLALGLSYEEQTDRTIST